MKNHPHTRDCTFCEEIRQQPQGQTSWGMEILALPHISQCNLCSSSCWVLLENFSKVATLQTTAAHSSITLLSLVAGWGLFALLAFMEQGDTKCYSAQDMWEQTLQFLSSSWWAVANHISLSLAHRYTDRWCSWYLQDVFAKWNVLLPQWLDFVVVTRCSSKCKVTVRMHCHP
jgi:hypothetical protein